MNDVSINIAEVAKQGIHNFIDIRLRPGIATPLVAVGKRFSLPRIAIRQNFIRKTGSTYRNAARSSHGHRGSAQQISCGPAVPEICSWTDRHTDKLIAIYRSTTGPE